MAFPEREGPEFREHIPEPSANFAWILGVLSAGGHVDDNKIRLSDGNYELVERFTTAGEEVFHLQGRPFVTSYSQKKPRWSDMYGVRFYSSKLKNSVGDLRRYRWAETIRERHQWIYENESYILSFVSGFLDARSIIYTDKDSGRYGIVLSCSSQEGCQEISQLLSTIGLEGTTILRSRKQREGVSGVGVFRWPQARKLALQVRSCIPDKDVKLEFFRQTEERPKRQRNLYADKIKGTYVFSLEDHKKRVEAYEKTMEVRSRTGLGAKGLVKHPDLIGYGLSPSAVAGWIYDGRDPRRYPSYRAVKQEASKRHELNIGPSSEFAWLLGVLSAGGFTTRYEISTRDVNYGVVEKFMQVGEKVFQLPGYYRVYRKSQKNPNQKDVHQAAFHSAALSDFLGDLHRYRWGPTLKNRHDWIYQDKESIWAFLNGFFDARGYISTINSRGGSRKRHILSLSSPYNEGCLELSELFSRVDFPSVKIIKEAAFREAVKGVRLYRQREVREFAIHVSSCVPFKEKKLQECRNIDISETFDPGQYQRRLEAYEKVMQLREQTGWGARRLVKHSELAPYNLSNKTVESWIYTDRNPHLDKRFNTP